MHPAVVRAQLAAADDHEVGNGRREIRARREIVEKGGGASSILPEGVRRSSGIRGASGPRSMPYGAAFTFANVRPSGASEVVAVRTAAQREIEQPLGAALRRHGLQWRSAWAPVRRRTSSAASSSSRVRTIGACRRPPPFATAFSRSRICHSAGRPGAARAPAGCSARGCGRELGKRDVVVRLLERRRPGRITSAWRVVSLR